MLRVRLLMVLALAALGTVSAAELKLMTYNVCHGRGMDFRLDLPRTAAVINREKPDFVGLQEIDWRTTRVKGMDEPAELARLTGLEATFSRAIFFKGGQYGVMLLSREKPLAKKEVPLPGAEPRILLLCEFADCVVGTTHLSVSAEAERAESVRLIREAVGSFAGQKPVFLTGDWNSTPESAVVRDLQSFLRILSTTNGQTFHGRTCDGPGKSTRDGSKFCIDYIAVDAASAERFTVADTRIVDDRLASDHAPVVVTLTLDDPVLPAPALIPQPADMRLTGGILSLQARTVTDIPLVRTCSPSLPAEGYRLSIAPTGIQVAASDEAGAFYARQTLRQLAEPRWGRLVFPCCEIVDAPRFGWRGVHVDESRHFFGKAAVKRLLELMARHKLNVFHWHLTDDEGWRFPLANHPRLMTVGATRAQSTNQKDLADLGEGATYGPFAYSEADIREIVAFARERHIRLVPEIDFPGHSRALLKAYPSFGCSFAEGHAPTGAVDNVLCLGQDATLAFMKEVFDEVLRLFPDSPVIHVGGDEVNKVNWSACTQCCARRKEKHLADAAALHAWYFGELTAYLAAKGRRIVGWDEMALEGPMPAGAIVMSWRGREGAVAAARAGLESILCPHTACYFDYDQGLRHDPAAYPWFSSSLPLARVYAYDPLAGLPESLHGRILGGQCCNWTEYTCNETELQWKLWPRACATAEVFWTPQARRGWADFCRRAEVHRNRLLDWGVHCAPLK